VISLLEKAIRIPGGTTMAADEFEADDDIPRRIAIPIL
jgi:hypothetical protein